jgi:hypothetical protein
VEKITVLPDATRTLTGLAHQGYTPQTAIADIIDNSIAADATRVDIKFAEQFDGSTVVSIADNGVGMSLETLKSAMQIGSSASLANSSLSVYGMGMKTASMSFSRKFSVVSRDKSGITSEASWDLDSQTENPWTIDIGPASRSHQRMLDDFLGEELSGTIVIWERADFKDAILDHRKIRGRKPAVKNIQSEVKEYLSMVFHRFMDGTEFGITPVSLSFNGELLEPWCPYDKDFLSDNWKIPTDHFKIDVEIDGEVVTVPYSITTYQIYGKDEGEGEAVKRSNLGMKTQGIYPYRENRLLQSPDWLNVLAFHPDINTLRVVLELDPRLDGITRTDMKKSGLSLPPQMWEDIREKVNTYAVNVRNNAKDRKREKNAKISTDELHKKSNKTIAAASTDIEQPVTSIQKDGSVKVSTQFGESITELPTVETLFGDIDRRVYSVDDLEGGVLFEPRMQGSELVIYLNKRHPFYQKLYLGLYDVPLAIQGLDFLLYSLAHAELLTRTDRIKEQFRRMRNEMSDALRVLVLDLDDPDDDIALSIDN